MTRRIIIFVLLLFVFRGSIADDFIYESIANRNPDVKLDATAVKSAKMQGECLVGLKNLNFRKKKNFDAIAEWSNYRSFSLLEQFPPCTVLIIMEVAYTELKKKSASK